MTEESPAEGVGTIPRSASRTAPRAPVAARLVVVHPGPSRVVPLATDEVVLGRADGDGVRGLGHGTVSRRHLAIAWDERAGHHVARDLASRNGSALDGAPLATPTALVDNAVLRLGDVLAIYERWRDGAAVDAPEVSRAEVPGDAIAIGQLRARLARAAGDRSPVLLYGETGTGKERVAAELHARSGRAGAYVRINCAALSAQLVESQLFGHERGAFTGAGAAQPGVLREADGGTVLLDEIGDLPLDLQPKLLRALQEGEILPVGSARPVRVDVRVVAATHQDLGDAVAQGRFRRDLRARLALWELRVPALRERKVDLLGWIARLERRFRAPRGDDGPPLAFDADAAEALLGGAWPDNLRGLDRLVHALASEPHAGVVTRHELPAWVTAAPDEVGPDEARPAARLASPSREEFLEAHRRLGGNVSALARHFARDRRQIYRWLEAHGLKPA